MSALELLIACAVVVILIIVDVRHYRGRERKANGSRDDRESGRVRLVPLVLLAGLAFLAWLCRDLIVLVWLMFTTTVH